MISGDGIFAVGRVDFPDHGSQKSLFYLDKGINVCAACKCSRILQEIGSIRANDTSRVNNPFSKHVGGFFSNGL